MAFLESDRNRQTAIHMPDCLCGIRSGGCIERWTSAKGVSGLTGVALHPAHEPVMKGPLHVCSIWDDSVPEEMRGKYLAFAEEASQGVRHLRELQEAGMTHIHLLPAYDYGSVPERYEDQKRLKVCSVVRLCV